MSSGISMIAIGREGPSSLGLRVWRRCADLGEPQALAETSRTESKLIWNIWRIGAFGRTLASCCKPHACLSTPTRSENRRRRLPDRGLSAHKHRDKHPHNQTD